jgi:hypothetical protein
MRSLLETQNAIKGQSVPGINSKINTQRTANQDQPQKTLKVAQSFNYGTNMIKPGALQVRQKMQNY